MNVVIDFRMHNASGIGVYISNIIPFLVDKLEITLLGNKDEILKYEWSNKVKIIDSTVKIYSIKEQFELFIKIPRCDVFWSPHYNVPLLPIKAKKRIVTVHDVLHLADYKNLSLGQKFYAKFVIPKALRRSDVVFTVSKFSKNEIELYTNFKASKVVGCSIDKHKFKNINSDSVLLKIRQKYSLPYSFLLFVGNIKPHKNLKNLLLAIKDISENLVIVGKRDGFITGDNNEILDMIVKYGLQDRIFFTGYVEDMDIPVIYNIAKLFVFPTLYEGFGIPPLEAQACGCPVVCSHIASLPEIAGKDAVLYFNPRDILDIKEKIVLVLKDKIIQHELIEKGLENIKRFSWEDSAKLIMNEIESLE